MVTERTRDRVVDAGMRLFGEKGYAATTVAEIEAAAGLSPGSGSLYRHFASKEALLVEGVERRIREGRELLGRLGQLPPDDRDELDSEAASIVDAALRRLEVSGDLNRMMVKDLNDFPALMKRVREEELAPVYTAVAAWVSMRSAPGAYSGRRAAPAPEALATVLVGATAHYWLLRDSFGEHPSGVSEKDFVEAVAAAAGAAIRERT